MNFFNAVKEISNELVRDRIKVKVIIKGVNDRAPSYDQEVVITSDNEKEALCKMVAKLAKLPRYQGTRIANIAISVANIGLLCDYLWKTPKLRTINYIDMVN